MNDYKMTPGELRATWGLGTVFSLRMLGMFMVLPVLTTYGMALQGASEALIGLAIGIYGLAQAIFQIPFGLLSDRVGRKPLIVGGLLVFVLGSVIAALSHSIWGIILGRALQGSGAIAAAVMALSAVRTMHRPDVIAAAKAGTLCVDKLEAMTCVCSVGLDMIAVPGDTSAETISAIIADEAAIGMVNNKTTAVRLLPTPGKNVGDTVEMGGLLGSAPVMPVHKESSADFIQRGGRIPAPLHSLRN